MLDRITMTFTKNYVTVNKKYHCKKCGFRFYRKNRDWFTINPLSTSDYNTAREEKRKAMEVKVRECPKCREIVIPS
jgi:ribosomal protein S27AE